ncbi:MAG: TIR domain-containing protein [Cyclobacteriaceae bacterium]
MSVNIEDVFVTEGFPELTFVYPPNFYNILIDIKRKGKPVVIEGQSGTGKTTAILKILEEISGIVQFKYLTARKRDDVAEVFKLTRQPDNGNYVIDDFHRLAPPIKKTLADYAKISADEGLNSTHPKLVIIGINKVGSELLGLAPDIAKRCGIHRIETGDWKTINELIAKGEKLLNIKFFRPKAIFNETKGDYWLTQALCQLACIRNGILDNQEETKYLSVTIKNIRKELINRLENGYSEIVKTFARGKRFRPTNDPYYLLLKALSEESMMPVDLTEIANKTDNSIRNGINKIKESRLGKHIADNQILSDNFYYNPSNTIFNIEDPALFYYIKHLDWKKLKKECGFKTHESEYKFDIAISFAGENRKLAEYISSFLRIFDFEVFYDELYEANYLGSSWSDRFEEVFNRESRYVLCLLDANHKNKIWPTFERECFQERVREQSVIPVFLDDTKFSGIPQDIVGIKYSFNPENPNWRDTALERIIKKLLLKLD